MFLGFLILFWVFFHKGFVLYGDFSTTFPQRNDFYYLKILPYAWQETSFLGYESIFYATIRLPFYLIVDTITFLFGVNYYWLFFVFLYFFRYYFFYKFLRYLDAPTWASVFVSLAYVLNFYFIDRLGHTYISFASITIPLAIIAYLELSKSISIRYLLLFYFSLLIIASSMHVTLMTIYFFFLLGGWLLVQSWKKKEIFHFIKRNAVIGVFCLLGFAHIVMPLFYISFLRSSEANLVQQVANQANQSIYVYGKTSDLPMTISGQGYFYSDFLTHETIAHLGIFFFISIVVFIFYNLFFTQTHLRNSNSWNRNLFSFFQITLLLFLFLSSFSLLEPWIPFLKKELIGFGSIKDSSYFLLYFIFSLFVLFGISLRNNQSKRHVAYVSFFVCFLIFINIFAFLKFEVFSTFVIPSSYYDLENYISKNERTLILPLGWVNRMDAFDRRITSGFFNLFYADFEIVGQNIIEGPSITTQKKIDALIGCVNNACTDLPYLLEEINITQVVNFKGARSEKDTLLDYSRFIEIIQKHDFQLTYSNDEYDVYEFKDYLQKYQKIYSEKMTFEKINPTKYILNFKDIKKDQPLVFLDSFSSDWKLIGASSKTYSYSCFNSQRYRLDSAEECYESNYKNNIFDDLRVLYFPELFSKSHEIIFDYANQWSIDPEYIKNNLPVDSWEENSDGSISFTLMLYYKPQAYFNLGLIISGITLIGFFGYFGFDFYRRKKRNIEICDFKK